MPNCCLFFPCPGPRDLAGRSAEYSPLPNVFFHRLLPTPSVPCLPFSPLTSRPILTRLSPCRNFGRSVTRLTFFSPPFFVLIPSHLVSSPSQTSPPRRVAFTIRADVFLLPNFLFSCLIVFPPRLFASLAMLSLKRHVRIPAACPISTCFELFSFFCYALF